MTLRLDGMSEVKVERVEKQVKVTVTPTTARIAALGGGARGVIVYPDMAEVKALTAALAELSKG